MPSHILSILNLQGKLRLGYDFDMSFVLCTVCTQTIKVFADYKLDESYTPSKIFVRCGTNFHDLQVCLVSLIKYSCSQLSHCTENNDS